MKPFARYISEKWSREYKQSINCSNPKGFSQRAHCAGKRKQKVDEAAHLTPRRREVLGAIGRAAQHTLDRRIPDNTHQAAWHKRERVRNAVDAALSGQNAGNSKSEKARRKRVVGHKLALRHTNRMMQKHYEGAAAAAGETKRGYETRWRKKYMGEAVTDTARKQRNLESSMSAFMERVRHARRTHPVIRAWVLVEPEQHSGDRLVPHSSGKKPVHAWVEDATDSDHVYHYRGEYWWNPSRGDWWMRGSTRIHKSDARREWEQLQPVAAATGEWHDGVLTVLHPQ